MTLQRYLTRLIWLTIVPVLALALGLSYVQFAHQRDDDGAEAQRLASGLAHTLEQALQVRIGALQMLARSPLAAEPRWRELHAQAQGVREAFGGHVVLIDAQLRMRLHTSMAWGGELPPLPQPDGRAAVPLVLQTARPAVGDPFVGPLANETHFAVAVPLVRPGQAPAALVSIVPLRQLASLLDDLQLPNAWIATLHDSRARVMVRRGGAEGDADGAHDGQTMLRFVDQPRAAPWTVEVRIPRTTYAQHLASVAGVLLLALLGVTAISVAVGRWGRARLVRAVHSLVDEAPAGGRVDEIEEIADARRRLDDAQAQREVDAIALQVREEQLRRIFESASEAIITADASQTIVRANPAAASIFGLPLERLIGSPLGSLMPERFRASHQEDVGRFGRDESATRPMGRRPDVVGLRGDGSEFPIEAAISQVHVDGQRLYTVILRDVTERRRTEMAVAAAKARLEATIESMRDALVIVGTGGRLIEVNGAFLRMYGFAGKADCPRALGEIERLIESRTLDGQLVSADQWLMARALRGESGNGIERRLRRRDTGLSWIGSFSFAPVRDAQDQLLGAVVSVRDVTEQRRLEEELRASHADLARLVAAQQSVEEEERRRIARELHDELQQVLAAIKMDAGSIESQLPGDPSRAAALAARIDDLATAAITSSRRIVNDLRPLLLEELGLVPALESLTRQFAERTGIVATFDCSPRSREHDGPSDALAICLYRVAQEALNNVAKHAAAGRVRVTLSMTETDGWRLKVSDDGRGLRSEDRNKPTSFGLRGMAERVRALGGTLCIDSDANGGVTLVAQVDDVAAVAPDDAA